MGCRAWPALFGLCEIINETLISPQDTARQIAVYVHMEAVEGGHVFHKRSHERHALSGLFQPFKAIRKGVRSVWLQLPMLWIVESLCYVIFASFVIALTRAWTFITSDVTTPSDS